MNALQQFLLNNPVNDVKESIIVSERLKDHKFEIKAVTGDEYNSYQAQCIENPNSAKKRRFNTKRFNELLVLNHTVTPSFKDAAWLEEAGVGPNPAALMYKVLLAGEINELADKILRISGFSDVDFQEQVDEAKN